MARTRAPIVVTIVWLEVAAAVAALAFVAWQQVPRPVVVVALLGGAALVALMLAVPVRGRALGAQLARRLRFRRRRRYPWTPARVGGASTRAGQLVGVVSTPPTAAVVISVGRARASMVQVGDDARVPLRGIIDRLRGSGITYDSVSVIYERGDGSGFDDRVLVVVRVDPLSAREAIALRGGGERGLAAVLTALAGHVRAAVSSAGLSAEVLGPDETSGLLDEAGATIGLDGVSETWRDVTTASASHRMLALTHFHQSTDVTSWPLQAGSAVAVRAHAGTEGETVVRVVVRASGAQASDAASAHAGFAAVPGVSDRGVGGLQRAGLADSTILGSPEPMRDADQPWPDRWPTLSISQTSDLDRLSPALAAGVRLGRDRDGAPIVLDVDGALTRTVAVVGDGWLATRLVEILCRAGRRVAVATTRPAPWRALERSVGQGLQVVDVTGSGALPRSGSDIVVDDVLDLPQAADLGVRRPGRTVFVVRPSIDAIDTSTPSRLDLVLATASGLQAFEGRTDLLGVPASSWAASAPVGDEALVIEPGRASIISRWAQ